MSYKLGDQIKEVDYEKDVDPESQRQRITVSRIRMLQREPFYGTLAINLRLKAVEKDHKIIKTAAVDGKNFYFNPNFIEALDDDELLFLVAHEVMHCVLRHLTRRGKRDPRMWNQAGDYIINYILVRDNIGKFPTVGGLYDDKYGKMTTEDAYDAIKEDNKNGNGGEGGPGGSGNFDDHIEVNIGGDGDEDGDGSSGSVTISEDEATQIENEVRAAIQQAAEAAKSSGAGNVPAEIARLIEQMNEPRMNWRDFLRQNAQSQVRTDYTWKRPNRRFMASGIIMPGTNVDEHFEFTVALDASGSMSREQLRDFLSEIYGIADSFKSFKVGVFTFDTKAYNYQEFDQDNIDDMLEYEPKGGGGTDFMCAYDYMKELDIQPKTFVMLTDGYPGGTWGDEEYCEAVFVIHDPHAIQQRIKAPFGTTVYYDDYTG